MAICGRCGADDLLNSDLCGRAGCIYCCGTPVATNEKKDENVHRYTLVVSKEKKCPKCGKKTYLVKESKTCEECYLRSRR